MTGMIAGHLALIIAAVFTGAAIYVNVVEQPTSATGRPRLACAVAAELQRGFAMQAPLAILAGIPGVMAFLPAMTGDCFLALPSLSRTGPIRCWSSCRRITGLWRLRQKLLGLRLDAQSSIGQRS